MTKTLQSGILGTLLELAARDVGVSAAEVASSCNCADISAMRSGRKASASGLVICVDGLKNVMNRRWFVREEDAAEYRKQVANETGRVEAARAVGWKTTPTIKRDSTADESSAKFTRIATPLGRYEVAPGSRPFGAGFAAVGIGRDIETGKAWGA